MGSLDVRFRGLTRVASGAMGIVYKAWDLATSQHVAVKVPCIDDLPRFWRETHVLERLCHPHIVRFVDRGCAPGGKPWLAMEWLVGEDLDTRLARGSFTVAETLALAAPIASALAWAHAQGFIHRDLKPSNLFLVGGDPTRARVLDFGLARLTTCEPVTQTGMFMGTLAYVSPEQASDAKRAGPRADVYSFGALLFHALVGAPPVTVASLAMNARLPNVRTLRPDVPAALGDLVEWMLAADPRARPADGAQVARALASISRPPSTDDWDAPTELMAVTPRPMADTLPIIPTHTAIPRNRWGTTVTSAYVRNVSGSRS